MHVDPGQIQNQDRLHIRIKAYRRSVATCWLLGLIPAAVVLAICIVINGISGLAERCLLTVILLFVVCQVVFGLGGMWVLQKRHSLFCPTYSAPLGGFNLRTVLQQRRCNKCGTTLEP